MEIGVFIPIGSNGWLISTTSPQYKPSFELNKQTTLNAERYGLDFVLSTLVPGLEGKSRVVMVPRRGPVLCVTGAKPARADALLAELAKGAAPASAPARPAVPAGGADHVASDPEQKSAADA